MPDITLTPSQVAGYQLEASVDDIADAKVKMHAQTGYTAEEHRDVRSVDEGSIRRAWAIAASRLRRQTGMDGSEDLASESQDDYSYNRDGNADPMRSLYSGKPWELLEMGTHGSWHAAAGIGSHARVLPGFYDDYGVWFPDP